MHRRRLTASDDHVILPLRMLPHDALINLFYPPACLLCQAPTPEVLVRGQASLPSSRPSSPGGRRRDDSAICDDCVRVMPRSGPPVCTRCGAGLPGAFDAILQCAACRTYLPVFEMARAPWEYAGPVQEAVRQFKYHRRWRIGQWLAQEMVAMAQRSLPLDQVTLVVAVPLHWVKRRFKGFNPAEHLASTVAQSIGKPYAPKAMRRTRWTRTQTRLDGRKRLRNVLGAFAANKGTVNDHTVLLVDDVLTSGATVNASARALKDAGARRVFVLTAARTSLV